MAAVGVVFIGLSLANLPLGTPSDPGAGAAPLLISGLLVACALWSMVSEHSAVVEPSQTQTPSEQSAALRHAALIAAAAFVAALGFGHAGYRLTILALLLFFFGAVERKPIVVALVVSAALSFGSHALFEYVLKVPLPSGPFGL